MHPRREQPPEVGDEAVVFDRKAVHSFIGKPVTDNHPTEAVNAENWRDHARGLVMGAVRDGEHVAFDLLLTDAAAIKAVEGGIRNLRSVAELMAKAQADSMDILNKRVDESMRELRQQVAKSSRGSAGSKR